MILQNSNNVEGSTENSNFNYDLALTTQIFNSENWSSYVPKFKGLKKNNLATIN